MIVVKAISDNSKGGCNVSIKMGGTGTELVEETLALIQGVMGSLKEQDFILHMLALKAIAENSEILFGEECDEAKEFERLVATTKFREGIH